MRRLDAGPRSAYQAFLRPTWATPVLARRYQRRPRFLTVSLHSTFLNLGLCPSTVIPPGIPTFVVGWCSYLPR
jgi:hypothetical protein